MATLSKQETLVYALGAAGLVIVVLLGTVVYLVSSGDKVSVDNSQIPVAAPAPGAQSAPPLSQEQIEGSSGQLPSGHVPVQDDPGAPGAPAAGTDDGSGEAAGDAPPVQE